MSTVALRKALKWLGDARGQDHELYVQAMEEVRMMEMAARAFVAVPTKDRIWRKTIPEETELVLASIAENAP